MSGGEHRMLVEAACYLGIARFYVSFLPLHWYVSSLGPVEPSSHQSPEEISLISMRVGKAILRAANHVPWCATCLPQAIAAKWMLRRRCISSVLFLGVSTVSHNLLRHELPQVALVSQLSAHAWLKAGEIFVTGKLGHKRFTVLQKFH
jgi:transglutaminase superfamily protein